MFKASIKNNLTFCYLRMIRLCLPIMICSFVGYSQTIVAREHPFLFINKDDIQRAKSAAKTNPEFEKIAQDIIQKAKSADLNVLPEFENDWWRSEKDKGYLEVHNPTFLKYTHTFLIAHGLMARNLAYAHILKPDEHFDRKAIQVLLKMAEHTCEFESVNAGLYYSRPSGFALEAYDILYDSVTPDEREIIDGYYTRLLPVIQKCNEYWIEHEPGGPLNNHYGWHKFGLAMIGLFYDKPELVENAIFGSHGFDYSLRHGFHDDGIWLEGSLPYHFVQLDSMLWLAELTRKAGYPINLYDYTSPDGRILKQGYDAMIELLLPDGTIPPIGDGYGTRRKLSDRNECDLVNAYYNDPVYAWLIKNAKKRGPLALFYGDPNPANAEPPSIKTKLWHEHGLAALRTNEGINYWSGKGWTLMATYGNNFIHHHADKLSIMIFGDGHLWMPDTEAKIFATDKFSSDINQCLNWTTLSHNTVLIDMSSQNRSPLRPMELIEFENLDKTKRISISDLKGQLYSGVRQIRTCVVKDEYILDVFQVDCDQPRDITWACHIDAKSTSSFCDKWIPHELPKETPWGFLKEPHKAEKTTTNYSEEFEQNGGRFQVQVWSAGNVEVIRCGFPRSDKNQKLMPMRMLSLNGKTATFVAVYRMGSECNFPVRIEVESGAMKSIYVNIYKNDKKHVHRIPSLRAIIKDI